jgi:hypothetical protein
MPAWLAMLDAPSKNATPHLCAQPMAQARVKP